MPLPNLVARGPAGADRPRSVGPTGPRAALPLLALALVALLLAAACAPRRQVVRLTPGELAPSELGATLPAARPALGLLPRASLLAMPPLLPRPANRLSLVAVGDVMLGTHYPDSSYLPPAGPAALLTDLAPLLRAADVTFGNLEGVLLDTGAVVKRCQDPDACYAFRSPEAYAATLADAGFDFLSLANNHSGDFGAHGRDTTKRRLGEVGIAYAGLRGTDEIAYRTFEGRRFAFLGFSPNAGTVDILDLRRARELVAAASERADVVVVSFHGGAEGADAQHVPRASEKYYGEDRGDVYAFAHACVDAGADLLLGHGPHVTRGVELYRGRLIAYSLGNFATYGRFSLRGPKGVAPVLKVDVDGEGAFLSGEIVPTYQTKPTGPRVDPAARATELMRALTLADFPESPLVVDAEGKLVVTSR